MIIGHLFYIFFFKNCETCCLQKCCSSSADLNPLVDKGSLANPFSDFGHMTFAGGWCDDNFGRRQRLILSKMVASWDCWIIGPYIQRILAPPKNWLEFPFYEDVILQFLPEIFWNKLNNNSLMDVCLRILWDDYTFTAVILREYMTTLWLHFEADHVTKISFIEVEQHQ